MDERKETVSEELLRNTEAVPEKKVQKQEVGPEQVSPIMRKTAKERRDDIRRRATFIETAKLDASTERLLTGNITTVGTISVRGEKTACVVFPFRNENEGGEELPGVNVVIPFGRLFAEEPKIAGVDGSGSRINAELAYLRDMIGAEISYVVTDAMEKGSTGTVNVYGDRKRALEILRELDYTDKGKEKGRKQYENGGVYWGRVVLTNGTKTVVTLGGVEKTIPLSILTSRYCPVVKRVFYPGKRIPIYVDRITVKDGVVDARLDTLKGEAAYAAGNLDNFKVGDITVGTISKFKNYIEADGRTKLRVYGWHEMMNVPIFFTDAGLSRRGVPLEPGDKVLFRVTGISGKYNTVEGHIMQVL